MGDGLPGELSSIAVVLDLADPFDDLRHRWPLIRIDRQAICNQRSHSFRTPDRSDIHISVVQPFRRASAASFRVPSIA